MANRSPGASTFWRGFHRLLLGLLLTAGVLSGGFLLLCALGILPSASVSPSALSRAETAAPALSCVPVPAPFHAVALDPDSLPLSTVPSSQALVVSLKDSSGTLAYCSALPLSRSCGASLGSPQRNKALRALNDTEGLYTVARISCFSDACLAQARPDLALQRVSGSPWRGSQGLWLDPSNSQVQTYLVGLCKEAADLGFDEILLSHCFFPYGQDLSLLEETPNRAAVLESFFRRAAAVTAAKGTLLSIQAAEDAGQPDSASGQTLSLLAAAGRVWLTGETGLAAEIFAPIAPVLIRSTPGEDTASWAVLSP